ncbi:hypothetical protein UVI_02052710 [Ustilaginoidea virens]|uniref:Phosphatidylinositol N-acetylglucosaminyltransferase n=1 Tax=Ustilaginoidea virens TaxID=1159556 RepID=A0A1B5L9K0_USTVR|nr:hypothetical protein UVI_02052710 [Ustilaginoidea virens]
MPSPTDDETPFPDAYLSPPPGARDFDGRGVPGMRGVGERSRSRRRKRAWKKLMWVKQSWKTSDPDNYTDQATFLENLQLNPRLKPYDFWPLVADSTVILQQVCSVIIFIVCFVGIYLERVSPVSVVSWGSLGTFLGWLLWERLAPPPPPPPPPPQLPLPLPLPLDENRTHQRLGTIKSALLIYSTLLGLSPILKSLTRSTSSDSIWAISFWLLAINVFFFDYSGGVEAKFPASLSTNAALMASTVLASRLHATNQVFSLTLFSIEVFGLFPVFRRHVRHRSWRYHVLQTMLLVLGAGFGAGMVLTDAKAASPTAPWRWRSGVVGMALSVVISVLVTGGSSWWLIGLQKYKNEIRGPWDPARPIIMSRTRWDDG